jgi:hypothetical protein
MLSLNTSLAKKGTSYQILIAIGQLDDKLLVYGNKTKSLAG